MDDGVLQRLCQLGADDVCDFLKYQEVHDHLVIKAAVCTQQSDLGGAKVLQGRLQKAQYVVAGTGVARAQPEVGHQPPVRHEGQ